MKSATEFKYKVIYAMYQARFSLEEIRSVVTLSKCESIVLTRVEAIRMKNCTYGALPIAVTRSNPSTTVNKKMFEYKSIVDEYHDDERTKAEIKKVCKRMLRMFKTENQYEKEILEQLSKIAKDVCTPKFARELRYQRTEKYNREIAQQRPLPVLQMPNPYYYAGYQPTNPFERVKFGLPPYAGGAYNSQWGAGMTFGSDKEPEEKDSTDNGWLTPKEIADAGKPSSENNEDTIHLCKSPEEAAKKTAISVKPSPDSLSTVHYHVIELGEKIDNMCKFKEIIINTHAFNIHTVQQTKMNIPENKFGAAEAEKIMRANNLQSGEKDNCAIFVTSWVDVCGDAHNVNKWIIPLTVADPNGSHVEWYMIKYNKEKNTYVATDLQFVR